jgi:hypothetical protein
MAVATADQTLYGFIYWLKRNPFKSIEAGFTFADLDEMVKQYCAVNATDASLSSTDPLSYGDTQDIPKKGSSTRYAADGTGVSFTTPSDAVCNQSLYPDQHLSG